jgi:NADPH:quinone reductase-like Zn-dependent oxidoreductase
MIVAVSKRPVWEQKALQIANGKTVDMTIDIASRSRLNQAYEHLSKGAFGSAVIKLEE